MNARAASWSLVRSQQESRELSWTQRFVLGSCVVLLYVLVQVDWLGLIPGTATSLLAQATWVALTGWFALRAGAVGLAIGFVVAVFALFIDQMTLAVALPPAPTGLPDDYWLSNTLRVAIALAVYPLGVRAIGARLPRQISVLASPVVLLALPFIRWFDQPDLVLRAVTSGTGGVLVPVPWLQLIAAATALVIGIEIVATRIRPSRPVLAAVVFVLSAALVIPGSQAAADSIARGSGVFVTPSEGGPLETVRLETAAGDARTAVVFWDAAEARGPGEQPARASVRSNIATAFVTPALQPDLRPGAQKVGLRVGDATRTGTYRLTPANGLSLSLDQRVVVITGGTADAMTQVLVLGPAGAEQFTAKLDANGAWRAERALPTGTFHVICQVGSRWTQLRTD
jgi:hypothetical protein